MIDPRKLAAIDIVTLGLTLSVGNFIGIALMCLSLGAILLWRADSCQKAAFGLYFASLGINYMCMLFYALEINNRESARTAIGDEMNSERGAMAEYRRQSIYLLLPLVVPIVALQRRYRSGTNR